MTERWTTQDLADYQTRRGVRGVEIAASAKPSKYRNKRTEVDGIVFDSKREAIRYQDLKVMQGLGLISDLKRQITYVLSVNDFVIASYRSDFEYLEGNEWIVEDTKGYRTPAYKMKKRLMLALYGIRIRET